MPRTDTEALVVSLEARIKDFERNFAKANQTASRNWQQIERRGERASRRMQRDMAQATSGITAQFNRMGSAITGLLGGVGVGVAGLQRLVTDSLAAADAIAKVSETANVSTDFLQKMRFAASQSGIEARGLDDSLRRLTRRVGLFISEGGGPAENALNRLGLAARITSGELRGTEPIFNEIVKALQGIESQAERSALAAQLFGDDFGPKLLPLLNQGIDGIAKMTAEAERLGLVMDRELIEKAVRASDELDRLAFIIRTKTTVGVVDLVDDLRELAAEIAPIIEWIVRLADTFESVGDALSSMNLFENTLREIRTLKDFLRSLGADIREVDQATQEATARGAQQGAPATPEREIPVIDIHKRAPSAPIIPPAPMSREEAQRFNLPIASTHVGGPGAFADQLTALQAMRQEADEANRAFVQGEQQKQQAIFQTAQVAEQFALTFSGGIARLIVQGGSLSETLRGLGQHLAEMILQAAILGLIGTPGSAQGPGTGLFGALFAGGFASGGFIPAGRFGLVGERGPELITGPAQITPMQPMQSITYAPQININVEGGSRGEEADRELAGKIGSEVERSVRAMVGSEIRNQLRPGNMLNSHRSL